MKTCIYIHGLESKGGSRTAGVLREEFAGILNVVEPEIDYADIQSVVATITEAIGVHSPCFLIGSSMGGFVALQFPKMPKILINPALHPTETGIMQRHPQFQSQLPQLLKMEKYIAEKEKHRDYNDGLLNYGLFGTNDELFNYRAEFARDFSHTLISYHSFTCPDGHRLSEDTVRTKLKALIELLLLDEKIDAHIDATFFGEIDEEFAAECGIKVPVDEKYEQLNAERKEILKRVTD